VIAGKFYELLGKFNISLVLLDEGGGGNSLRDEISKTEQTIRGIKQEVTPVLLRSDITDTIGQRILVMYSRSDDTIKELFKKLKGDDELANIAHETLRNRIEKETILFPKKAKEFDVKRGKFIALQDAPRELKVLEDIDFCLHQLVGLGPAKDRAGKPKLTNNGFFTFKATRKDSAMSLVYASLGALIWDKLSEIKEEEEVPMTVVTIQKTAEKPVPSLFKRLAKIKR